MSGLTGNDAVSMPAAAPAGRQRAGSVSPATGPLTGREAWGALAVIALLLLPTLLFPPAADFSLFLVSARKILQGAALYVDIVDIKPPLIYHLYAIPLLFDGDWQSVRVFDFIVQAATAYGIFVLVRRSSASAVWAWSSIVVYATAYGALGFANAAIAETFGAALVVPMLALQIHRRTLPSSLLIGLLGGLLFVLKYTLVLPLAAAMLAERMLMHSRGRDLWQRLGLMVVGAALPLVAAAAYLSAFDAWDAFGEVNQFLAGYAVAGDSTLPGIAGAALRDLSVYFASHYSVALTVATILAGMLAVRPRRGWSGDAILLLRLALLCFGAMLLGVIVEMKFRPFHMARLLPYGAILGGAGAAIAWEWWKRLGYRRSVTIAALVALVALSPAPRYVWHGAAAAGTAIAGPRAFDRFYYNELRGFSASELDRIANFVRTERAPGDRLFVMSGMAGMVHELSGSIPDFRIFHAAFLLAPYAPDSWRAETRAYLLSTRPRFIVIHRNERMEEMTGTAQTSSEALRALPGVGAMIEAEYNVAMVTGHFEMFVRR